MISVLGHCVADLNNDASKVGNVVKCSSASIPNGATFNSSSQSKQNSNCGCDNMMEACGIAIGSNMWIKLVHETCGESAAKKLMVPKVHHIHWDGQVVSPCIVHVCKSCQFHRVLLLKEYLIVMTCFLYFNINNFR